MSPILRDLPEPIETERLPVRVPRPGDGERLFVAIRETLEDLRRFPA